MYSIQTIIYGIPLTPEIHKLLESLKLDAEGEGFTILYSGSSQYMPGYCGVELGQLDEAADYVRIETDKMVCISRDGGNDSFALWPIPTTLAEANKMMAALREDIRKIAPPPGVYLIYSTS